MHISQLIRRDSKQSRLSQVRNWIITLGLIGVVPALAMADSIAVSELSSMLLPAGSNATVLWSFHPAKLLILSLALPAALWVACAWKRALDNDPNLLRRSGLRELRSLLSSVRRCPTGPTPRHLHAWLRASARAWNVGTAAPTYDQLAKALVTCQLDPRLAMQWCDIWLATERSLFAADHRTPKNWIEQASQMVAETRKPPRTRWLPNRRVHWLPAVIAAVFIVACTPDPLDRGVAPEPGGSKVNQTAAARPRLEVEQIATLRALEANWNDWAAHYNVATTAMEIGDLNKAIGHATAAFVQHPNSRMVRHNLRHALQQLETVDPTLLRLLFGNSYQRLPAFASPAVWQRLALLASLVLAAGLGILVVMLYRPRRRRVLLRSGFSISLIGGVTLSMTIMGWSAYGDLNQPTAAIIVQNVNLSPVPTNLVQEEETIPILQGGVVLVMSRSYLGWKQIKAGRSRGWVRREVLLPLYTDSGSATYHKNN